MLQLNHKRRTRLQKRDDILKCAEQVFCKKGYVATTTEEIAEISGHSVGTIYNLFKNKDHLFAEVVLAIAQDLIREVEADLNRAAHDPESVLERQFQLRMTQDERYRLFLQLFFHQGSLPAPDLQQLPHAVNQACSRYFHVMEQLFDRMLSAAGSPEFSATNLVLCCEGFINMVIGYQNHGQQELTKAKVGQFIKQFFIASIRQNENQTRLPVAEPVESKQIFITRYDMVRLTDLINVYRSLQQHQLENHLVTLEQELSCAKIVRPREVPSDVITMNSRVRILNHSVQKLYLFTLVFPTDAKQRERISILDPLGTAMLGHRVGDTFAVTLPSGEKTLYQVEDVLYQPEASGDFHL